MTAERLANLAWVLVVLLAFVALVPLLARSAAALGPLDLEAPAWFTSDPSPAMVPPHRHRPRINPRDTGRARPDEPEEEHVWWDDPDAADEIVGAVVW